MNALGRSQPIANVALRPVSDGQRRRPNCLAAVIQGNSVNADAKGLESHPEPAASRYPMEQYQATNDRGEVTHDQGGRISV
jgi:hypothetical protein